MSIAPDKSADLRVKHLELVQAVVARMASNGAALKNWCITVTTAVCGFAITLQKPFVGLLALFPIIMFMLLDAQYLRLERRFRALFDSVRTGDWEQMPTFQIGLNAAPKISYAAVVGSWSILSFYVPLAAGVIVVVTIAGCLYGNI